MTDTKTETNPTSLEETKEEWYLEYVDEENNERGLLNGFLTSIKCKKCNKILAQYFEGSDGSTLALYTGSCKHYRISWWDRECYDILINDDSKEFSKEIIEQVFGEEKAAYKAAYKREENRAIKKIIADNAIVLVIPKTRRITNK